MARGTNLLNLLDQYRAECRLSMASTHNLQDRERQVMHIRRTQIWLWEDFDWPFLRVREQIDVAKGQRFYSMPEGISASRIQKITIRYNGAHMEMIPGIEMDDYTLHDPALNERDWPPRKWQISVGAQSDTEQLEIWPMPNRKMDTTTLEGRMTITAIRGLGRLAEEGDRAVLDDRLIILFCAAEELASRGDKGAANKLQMANKRYRALRGAQTVRKVFSLSGNGRPDTPYVDPMKFATYRK